MSTSYTPTDDDITAYNEDQALARHETGLAKRLLPILDPRKPWTEEISKILRERSEDGTFKNWPELDNYRWEPEYLCSTAVPGMLRHQPELVSRLISSVEIWHTVHCPDGTLHYWIELTPNERCNAHELATEREINNARKCFKCGVWK